MIYSSGFGTRNDDYDNDFSRDGSDKYNDMTTFAKMRAGTFIYLHEKRENNVLLLCVVNFKLYCNLKISM